MQTLKVIFLFVLCGLFLFFSTASATVSLPNVFGDNMVLQRDMENPVWGTAGPGESITITLNGKTVKTTAGKDAWK